MTNLDPKTVDGFGAEWTRFDQSSAPPSEQQSAFEAYFSVFPWERLAPGAVGFDLGCGSGRWARLVAPRVGALHCVDASAAALEVARRTLAGAENVEFHHASVGAIPLAPASMDFGYSLGVLHHVPDPTAALESCVKLLRPGAPFLVYLYYRFDDRPAWFRSVWRLSDVFRRVISRLPAGPRHVSADVLAATVYFPLARASRVLEGAGIPVEFLPLSLYRDKSFYAMRTDALDRFGTRLEHRFTRGEIEAMMRSAGLTDVRFRQGAPYWCAVGFRARD
jgi:SAM-dependent methyltransferase